MFEPGVDGGPGDKNILRVFFYDIKKNMFLGHQSIFTAFVMLYCHYFSYSHSAEAALTDAPSSLLCRLL